MNPQETFLKMQSFLHPRKVVNAAVFNTLRILKQKNKGDSYYENYKWHYQKRGEEFMDYYHLLWQMGSELNIERVIEIGCRTGISICQFLSSKYDYTDLRIVLFDIFNDGFISPEIVKMNLKHLNIPTNIVEFKIGSSLETVPKYKEEHPEEKFDYILVDGCHDKVIATQDLENVVPMLDDAGILIFDDISTDGCNLKDVWDKFKVGYVDHFYFDENLDGKGIGIGVKV